jgi:hypothetical protein
VTLPTTSRAVEGVVVPTPTLIGVVKPPTTPAQDTILGRDAAVHVPDPKSEYAVTSDPYVTATNRPVKGEHATEYQFEALGMVAENHDDPSSE